jgi:hypothetical protein
MNREASLAYRARDSTATLLATSTISLRTWPSAASPHALLLGGSRLGRRS